MKAYRALSVLPLVLLSEPAAAHLVSTRFGELYSGLLHPLTTLEHLVPWLGLGVLGALQSGGVARWALLLFPVSVLAGLGLATLWPDMGWIRWGGYFSFVVVGLLIAFAVNLGRDGFIALIVVFGLCHGYANASTDLAGYDLWLYCLGVSLAGYLLIALVTGSASALSAVGHWGRTSLRALGSWVAAAGFVYLSVLVLATS